MVIELMRWKSIVSLGVLTVLALPAVAVERRDVGRSGESSVAASTREVSWFDAARNRSVPATIYLPGGGEAQPVIVFSHGLGRSRDQYAYLGQYWSRHGYVVVMVGHAGSDEEAWRGKLRPRKTLRDIFEDPATSLHRPMDLSFAIDQLHRVQQTAVWGRRLDLSRIGVAGNDLGAQAALVLAGQLLPSGRTLPDTRVAACVALSPPVPHSGVPASVAFDSIRMPCMHVAGTDDDGRVGDTKAHERRLPFARIPGGDQYMVTLLGGDHDVYCTRSRQQSRAASDAHFQSLICTASTRFWDAYLKRDPAAQAALAGNDRPQPLGRGATIERRLQASADSPSLGAAQQSASATR